MAVSFPTYTESWTQHKGKNCYSGHGATDLDSGHGCGMMGVAACQARCDDLLACTGITMASGLGNSTCYRRTNIDMTECVDGHYDTWTKSVAPTPSPVPVIPGLVDVCNHLKKNDRCSPEICKMKAFQEVKLEAKTYYQDRSILLPEGSKLIGQGINKTYIISCGAPSSGRRGFILNNNTYLGHFTWQGLQASRGNFDAVVGTPGCLSTSCQGGCIPEDGNCAGIANAVVEHIHNSVFARGDDMWPLSTSVGWFPKTLPWGPQMATGSRNITVRGLVSWGTWADGINFHGGHHDVLIEQCELSFTGDDPIGLWPVSADARQDARQCQQNIVIRNNVARWPRQYSGTKAGGKGPRDFANCDCSDADRGQCYRHPCWATYAGGSGVQWVNNHCEGAWDVLSFNGDFPDPSHTKWCGVLTVVGNTYSQMRGQGSGCRLNSSTASMCNNIPEPPGTIGGQCSKDEAHLPPPCDDRPAFEACKRAPGVAGICFNSSAVVCVTASRVAEGAVDMCEAYADGCTIYK